MGDGFVSELIELMAPERLEDNIFRGQSRDIGTKYVFGGQVLGQALAAAQQTAPADRVAHSAHAYFLRAGNIDAPILYQVERTRDGNSFSARRVEAIQHGQQIFIMAVSFQYPESGVEHQLSMPDVPRPEQIEPSEPVDPQRFAELPPKMQRWLSARGPFEFRHVHPRDELRVPKRPPLQHVWFRLRERIGDNPALHRSLLAYASDFHLIGTTTLPHGISYLQPEVQMASLDHALWMHRAFRIDQWLLYSCDSPSASGARGFARGMIFNESGVLVASTAQEGLLRVLGDRS